jgi:hypothetical protein
VYSKLFSKIVYSSIWLEPHPTRIVWLTMLATMDEDGMCQLASVLNLARRAIVTVEEATAALKVLESPDPHSSDPDNDGRRIERLPGGWIVLNAVKYKAIVSGSESRRLARERAHRYRENKKNVTKRDGEENVTPKRDEMAERNGTVKEKDQGKESGVFELPLIGKQGEWSVPEDLYQEMVKAYPGVSVMAELANMRGWLISNPTRRKTRSGLPKFIN